MKVMRALALSIGELDAPVITKYQLGLILHKLYRDKEYKGENVNLQKEWAESRDFNKYLRGLLEDGVLNNQRDLPGSIYAVLGKSRFPAEDITCTIDPFCYISHLSAMSYHGLTNRIPVKLFISSPSPKEWKEFAKKKMAKDLGEDLEEYLAIGLPELTRVELKKIGKTEIHRYNSKHLGAFKNVRDRNIRVSTIGRTFLDMLRNPDLCGGINHVLEVFEDYSEKYLRLIVDEFEQHGRGIDKVRAGYIISERMGVKNEIIESWARFAQRGGSRKLDASNEYMPEWSDKWHLSINIF